MRDLLTYQPPAPVTLPKVGEWIVDVKKSAKKKKDSPRVENESFDDRRSVVDT